MSPPNKDSADVVDLETLGWGDWFAEPFRPHAAEGLRPARVAIPHNYLYQLYTTEGEVMAEAAGRLRQPVFRGIRDDVDAADVRREPR